MTQWVTSEDETATRCTTSKPSSRSSTTEARGPGLTLDWFIYLFIYLLVCVWLVGGPREGGMAGEEECEGMGGEVLGGGGGCGMGGVEGGY